MEEIFPEISIVIPVYNVENYLERCIESVLRQTFNNLEIILINDGSTDKSGKICDRFSEIDSRIHVVHKKNTGVADSRNIGMKLARGNFISFIDSDDYVEPDTYATFYNLIKKYKSDIAICGLVQEFGNRTLNSFHQEEEGSMSGKDAIKTALIGNKFSFQMNKLYTKNILEGMEFPILKHAEDANLIIRLFYKSKSVSYTTVPKYHWVRRQNSITTSNYNRDLWDAVTAYSDISNFIAKNCPDLLKEVTSRYYLSYFWVIDKMAISITPVPKAELNRALHEIRKGYFKVIFNPYFSIKRKLAVTFLLFSWVIYKNIVKRYLSDNI